MSSSSSSSPLHALVVKWCTSDNGSPTRAYDLGNAQLYFARQDWEWRSEMAEDEEARNDVGSGIEDVDASRQPLCWIRAPSYGEAIVRELLDALMWEARTRSTIRALVVDVDTVDLTLEELAEQGWRPWSSSSEENTLWYYPTGLGLVYEACQQNDTLPVALMARAWLQGAAHQLILAAIDQADNSAEFVMVAEHYLRMRCRLDGGERRLTILEWNTLSHMDEESEKKATAACIVWLLRSFRWLIAALEMEVVTLAPDNSNVYALLNEDNGGPNMISETISSATTGRVQLELRALKWPIVRHGAEKSTDLKREQGGIARQPGQNAWRRADLRFSRATGSTWINPGEIARYGVPPLSSVLFAGDRRSLAAYSRLWEGMVGWWQNGGGMVRVIPTGLGGGRDESEKPDAALIIAEKKSDETSEESARKILRVEGYVLGLGMGGGQSHLFAGEITADKEKTVRVIVMAARVLGVNGHGLVISVAAAEALGVLPTDKGDDIVM